MSTPSASSERRWLPTRVDAVHIAALYAAAGIAWILASDWLVYRITADHAMESMLQQLKGWLFVLTTAALLGATLDRYFTVIRRSARLLQDSEQRWHFALDGVGHGVWDWDVPRGTVFFSPRWKSMLGYEADEIGETLSEWESRVHPEDKDRVMADVLAHLEGRTHRYASEHRVRCKDASYLWVLDEGKVVRRGPDGRALRMIGTHADISARKAAEAAIRQWADAFLHCSHGIALGQPGAERILACNPALAGMLGMTVDQVVASPILGLFASDDHEHIKTSIATADCLGQVRFESQMVRSDGTLVPVQMDVVTVRDAQSQPLYRVATAQDIRARRTAEAARAALEEERARAIDALRSSEERHRALVETTADWVWEVDAAGHYTYASDKVRELLGFEAGEVIGRTPFDLMPAFEAERIAPIFASVAARHQPFSGLENVNVAKNGRLVVLETSGTPIFDAAGGLIGYRGMDRDITLRKEAEAALIASEERFRTLVENAPTGVFVAAGGHFAYMNPFAASLFDPQDRSRLSGHEVIARFHPDSRGDVLERLRNLEMRRQAIPRAEETCLRLDGSMFDVELSAVPFDYDGQPGALVYFHDITDRKQLEAQLRQAQKLEAIGQLAGGVAHDFNNILAAIMMNLGLLQMAPDLDPGTREAVGELEAQARRAAGLTRQLLMFSRRSVLAVRPVDLGNIVTDLLKMLGRLIGEQIDMRYDGQGSLPLVSADAGMLEQVLMNLVVNARDAMPKGGRITIGTSAVTIDDANGGERERRPGRFVCLSVTDTGSGMDAATKKRCFEPFFTTKEAGRGTGLGLATVHGIVAQHDGRVDVESEPGRGTTFRVLLPALEAGAASEGTAASATLAEGHETILLVEDDPALRQVAARSLRAIGYQVHEAGNGKEALRVWLAHAPQVDLLLTDMVMPEGISGIDLAEQLQSLKPDLRVIISSGYSSEFVQDGVPTGRRLVYLPKPYETRALAATVRQCLDAE